MVDAPTEPHDVDRDGVELTADDIGGLDDVVIPAQPSRPPLTKATRGAHLATPLAHPPLAAAYAIDDRVETGRTPVYRICDRKSLVRSSWGAVKKCSGVPTSTI